MCFTQSCTAIFGLIEIDFLYLVALSYVLYRLGAIAEYTTKDTTTKDKVFKKLPVIGRVLCAILLKACALYFLLLSCYLVIQHNGPLFINRSANADNSSSPSFGMVSVVLTLISIVIMYIFSFMLTHVKEIRDSTINRVKQLREDIEHKKEKFYAQVREMKEDIKRNTDKDNSQDKNIEKDGAKLNLTIQRLELTFLYREEEAKPDAHPILSSFITALTQDHTKDLIVFCQHDNYSMSDTLTKKTITYLGNISGFYTEYEDEIQNAFDETYNYKRIKSDIDKAIKGLL